ncbi:MAG: hypothetical protein O7E57_01095 [Gammaproteobacteria bacterium]|nr:hypothetical protein [Gammaproteobacteria bacterium]
MAELQDTQTRPCETQLGDFSKALNTMLWPAGETTRIKREGRVQLAAKTLALKMARAAARSTKNRHARAEIKAEIYSQLTPVLETLCLHERKLQHFYMKIIKFICACFAVVLVGILLAG